ncbi:MAG: cell division protein ZapA [Oscillospiraceae bacterium]|nr:cell division protein ZapA [Oscillospiraceae bacterium]
MDKIRVKLHIGGIDYYINTDETLEYTVSLGEKIDKRMTEILRSNSLITANQAAVLTALEIADELEKANAVTDNFRTQISEYLDEAAKAKNERDYYKRELERYKTEVSFKNDQINLFAGKTKQENDE